MKKCTIDIDEKIKKVRKERDMIEEDFEAFIKTLRSLEKEGKIEKWISDILKTYTDGLKEINRALNILYEWKGEAKK